MNKLDNDELKKNHFKFFELLSFWDWGVKIMVQGMWSPNLSKYPIFLLLKP